MSGGTIVVLGIGLQGRAALEDLERSPEVSRIVAADQDVSAIERHLTAIGARKTTVRQIDARDRGQLRPLLGDRIGAVVSLLPRALETAVAEVAVETGTHLVTTNYGHDLRHLDVAARDRSITIMPEAGFDPGIDLVIARRVVDEFDEVDTLNSYGSGVPAPECREANVINYKISWDFAGALRAYRRPARLRRAGLEVRVDGAHILQPQWVHVVEVGQVGRFEAFPNGDAVAFAEILGISATVRDTGRYTLRWPGHCAFWSKISSLGLLEEARAPGAAISPLEFLVRHLSPRLQYGLSERDMAILRVDAAGVRNGRRIGRRFELVGYRDLGSGLLAMNRLTGYPASIVAQMILAGTITRRGVGSAARDIPPAPFFEALSARNIEIAETEVDPADLRLALSS